MIIQGSNGVQLNLFIMDKGKFVDISGSVVTITLKTGPKEILKTSTIEGNGLVSTILSSDDLAYAGKYYVQATVSYTDGRLFYSEEGSFIVGPKL